MRDFDGPLSGDIERQIRQTVSELFSVFPTKKAYYGRDYAMDESDLLVVEASEIKTENGRFRLAYSLPASRPPFEWEYEITSEYNEADYFKHYLVRADDIVLAQRKVLIPIDDEEGRLILHDLGIALTNLAHEH